MEYLSMREWAWLGNYIVHWMATLFNMHTLS